MSKDTSSDVISGEIRTIASALDYSPTRKLVDREIKSVFALVAYVSYTLEINGSEILQMACKNFGVSKIEDVSVSSYNDLISFFVDFTNPSDMKN